MNKLIKFYSKLNKNNKSGKFVNEESSEGKKISVNAICLIIVAIVIGGGLGYLGYNFAEIITFIGGASTLIQIFGLLAAIVILILGFLNLLNSMYMSSDIEMLITLPFSSVQIATIRVLSFFKTGFLISLLFILPVNIGYAIICGTTIQICIAMLVSCILTPIFVISALSIILILIMSFIKIFRNKDILKYVGILIGFILLCVVYANSKNINNIDVSMVLTQVGNISQAIKYIVPTVGLSAEFINTGNWLYLLGSLISTLAVVGLFYLISNAFYLKGALSIQSTSRSVKILNDADLDKYCKKKKVVKALASKEYKMVKRNPVYILNNFIIGFLWPILVVLLFNTSIPAIQSIMEQQANTSAGLIDINLMTFYIIISVVASIAIFIGGMFLINHNIAYSSLTREGKSFIIMKQIPVSYIDQLKAKLKLADTMSQISITGYFVIILAVFAIVLKVPIYCIILPIILLFLYVKLMVNIDMLFALKNPNLNWDNEKAAVQKSNGLYYIIYVALWFGLPALLIAFMVWALSMNNIILGLVLMVVLIIIMIIVAIILNKKVFSYGEKRIKKIRV